MEQIRSFIAIELTGELKQSLKHLQDRLKEGSRTPIRWVDPDSIHLTLKFLGDIDVNTTGNIIRVIEKAAGGVPPFQLELGGLGIFPNPRRVQVVWVGMAGEVARLELLQKNIEAGLKPLGFAPESRPFRPHLTLGRVRDRARPEEREDLGRLITNMPFTTGGKMSVRSLNLMKSQLTREGPIYSCIGTVELK